MDRVERAGAFARALAGRAAAFARPPDERVLLGIQEAVELLGIEVLLGADVFDRFGQVAARLRGEQRLVELLEGCHGVHTPCVSSFRISNAEGFINGKGRRIHIFFIKNPNLNKISPVNWT